MANLNMMLVFVCILFCLSVHARGAMYIVGDNNGWDISTDLDSWANTKKFYVGDVLLFQYSSYHSVCELTKEEFDSCNTRKALETSSSGNTTFKLTKPGDRYFACGNRMHCMGGMKIQVHVQPKPTASPTAGRPPAAGGSPAPAEAPTVAIPGTSKNGKASVSSSAEFVGVGHYPFLLVLLGFVGCFLMGGVL